MEHDPLLRRIEHNAVLACLAAAGILLVTAPRGFEVALGVLAGGALVGSSYWAIKTAADALLGDAVRHVRPRGEDDTGGRAPAATGAVSRRQVLAVAKLTARYALLAAIAYVMIARLRLHAIGLIVGASSVVVAAAVEAVRLQTRRQPSRFSKASHTKRDLPDG